MSASFIRATRLAIMGCIAVMPVLVPDCHAAVGAKPAAGRQVISGRVVDAATGQSIPSRIYIEREDGKVFSPRSKTGGGVDYAKRNWINARAAEFHTTLPAGDFEVELEPGRYTIAVERGKEYRAHQQTFQVSNAPVALQVSLKRWINMAARQWFSGDTHVHRALEELPNLLVAEDLNVAFPLSYWVTKGFTPPASGDKNLGGTIPADLIRVDDTHVIWPRNTEWEIFTIGGRRHTLGAVFALGQRSVLTNGAPPVRPMAAAARREGALLDMDKHDWPWAIALVPLMEIDLFELSNNHAWRTEFAFTNWSTPAPAYMALPGGGRGGDERAWLEFTHRTYWALLNCGFRLRPTAGTASGVHPVPLGFSRVFVHLPGGFSYPEWMAGLNAGRSFVTTGPMLLPASVTRAGISGTVLSEEQVNEVEVIVNGEIRHRVPVTATKNVDGAWEGTFRQPLQLEGTSWVALRCWEKRPHSRERFAHTAPVWFDIAGEPLRPRREEAAYFVERMRTEIERSREILPASALSEYEEALARYETILKSAR